MIDHATLDKVSKFVHKTQLAQDLSHMGQAQNGDGQFKQPRSAVAAGNYDYDDGAYGSDEEDRTNELNDSGMLQNPYP